jgi:hypothetical protein
MERTSPFLMVGGVEPVFCCLAVWADSAEGVDRHKADGSHPVLDRVGEKSLELKLTVLVGDSGPMPLLVTDLF